MDSFLYFDLDCYQNSYQNSHFRKRYAKNIKFLESKNNSNYMMILLIRLYTALPCMQQLLNTLFIKFSFNCRKFNYIMINFDLYVQNYLRYFRYLFYGYLKLLKSSGFALSDTYRNIILELVPWARWLRNWFVINCIWVSISCIGIAGRMTIVMPWLA